MDDKDSNCCAATSGLGVNFRPLRQNSVDVFAAVRNNALDLPLGELTALEWAWVDGYKQGQKDFLEVLRSNDVPARLGLGEEMACKKKGKGGKGKGGR